MCHRVGCNTCAIYEDLGDLVLSKSVDYSQKRSLNEGFKYHHLALTTISAPLDLVWRVGFYVRRLIKINLKFIYFKRNEYYEKLGPMMLASYCLKTLSIFTEIMRSYRYAVVIGALTGEAFHDEQKAAARLLALYNDLNNSTGETGQSQAEVSSLHSGKRGLFWPPKKCGTTPFSNPATLLQRGT